MVMMVMVVMMMMVMMMIMIMMMIMMMMMMIMMMMMMMVMMMMAMMMVMMMMAMMMMMIMMMMMMMVMMMMMMVMMMVMMMIMMVMMMMIVMMMIMMISRDTNVEVSALSPDWWQTLIFIPIGGGSVSCNPSGATPGFVVEFAGFKLTHAAPISLSSTPIRYETERDGQTVSRKHFDFDEPCRGKT